MKYLYSLTIILALAFSSCSIQKMPVETVYDLPPNLFPLKVVSINDWSYGKNVYVFESPNHYAISRIYKTDPNLKIGTIVNLEDEPISSVKKDNR